MSDGLFSNDILKEFGDHATRMREAARARRQAVQLRAVVDDKEDGVAVSVWETLGVRLPNDKWAGVHQPAHAARAALDHRRQGFRTLGSPNEIPLGV